MSAEQLPALGINQKFEFCFQVIEGKVWKVIRIIGTAEDGTEFTQATDTVPTGKTPEQCVTEFEAEKTNVANSSQQAQSELDDYISQVTSE